MTPEQYSDYLLQSGQWKAVNDKTTNRTYFFNSATKERVWNLMTHVDKNKLHLAVDSKGKPTAEAARKVDVTTKKLVPTVSTADPGMAANTLQGKDVKEVKEVKEVPAKESERTPEEEVSKSTSPRSESTTIGVSRKEAAAGSLSSQSVVKQFLAMRHFSPPRIGKRDLFLTLTQATSNVAKKGDVKVELFAWRSELLFLFASQNADALSSGLGTSFGGSTRFEYVVLVMIPSRRPNDNFVLKLDGDNQRQELEKPFEGVAHLMFEDGGKGNTLRIRLLQNADRTTGSVVYSCDDPHSKLIAVVDSRTRVVSLVSRAHSRVECTLLVLSPAPHLLPVDFLFPQRHNTTRPDLVPTATSSSSVSLVSQVASSASSSIASEIATTSDAIQKVGELLLTQLKHRRHERTHAMKLNLAEINSDEVKAAKLRAEEQSPSKRQLRTLLQSAVVPPGDSGRRDVDQRSEATLGSKRSSYQSRWERHVDPARLQQLYAEALRVSRAATRATHMDTLTPTRTIRRRAAVDSPYIHTPSAYGYRPAARELAVPSHGNMSGKEEDLTSFVALMAQLDVIEERINHGATRSQ